MFATAENKKFNWALEILNLKEKAGDNQKKT